MTLGQSRCLKWKKIASSLRVNRAACIIALGIMLAMRSALHSSSGCMLCLQAGGLSPAEAGRDARD